MRIEISINNISMEVSSSITVLVFIAVLVFNVSSIVVLLFV